LFLLIKIKSYINTRYTSIHHKPAIIGYGHAFSQPLKYYNDS